MRHSEPALLPENASPANPIPSPGDEGGRALEALHKRTIEPVFAIMDSPKGFRQFSSRVGKKVAAEWVPVCLA